MSLSFFSCSTHMFRLCSAGMLFLSHSWSSAPGHLREVGPQQEVPLGSWLCAHPHQSFSWQHFEMVEGRGPGVGWGMKVPSKCSSAGTPENSTIANTIACCFIFSSTRGLEGNRGCGNPIFCSVSLMELLAVFMPDFLSSEVGHAYSPELHFAFTEEERNG